MSSSAISSALATEWLDDHALRALDVASVGTTAELDDLDELADLASADTSCRMSISEIGTVGAPPRRRGLQNRKLPAQTDFASVGTRAGLEDLDELADLASADANCLLSISEMGAVGSPQRRRCLRNRKLQTQALAPPGLHALHEDKQSLLCTLERNPFALEFASEELRADYDVVARAVSVDGLALRYAAPCLQNDREVVLLAIRASGGSGMKFASPELRGNKQFALAAVSMGGYALQHLSLELADDEDIVRAATSQTSSAWEFASARLQHDALFWNGHTLSEMGRIGYTATDAKVAGHNVHEIRRAGYTGPQARAAGFSLHDIFVAGYPLCDLRVAGFSAADATAAGYTAADMKGAGYRSKLAKVQAKVFAAKPAKVPKPAAAKGKGKGGVLVADFTLLFGSASGADYTAPETATGTPISLSECIYGNGAPVAPETATAAGTADECRASGGAQAAPDPAAAAETADERRERGGRQFGHGFNKIKMPA